MTLAEAKEQSLKRWRKILEDYPNVKMRWEQPDDEVYGNHGICDYVYDCKRCPLYPKYCGAFENKSIFWQICEKLEAKKPCKRLIQQMIKAIEEIK